MYQEITIQLLEQCNLECPYCFAPKADAGVLSAADFAAFADFCVRNKPDCIHITGGEPTMHPAFEKIVDTLVVIAPLVIYSNFTIPGVVQKIQTDRNNDIFFLVNINNREYYMDSQWKTLHRNIKAALNSGIQVALGHTFSNADGHSLESDFDYLLEILRKYHLTHLRLSQASVCLDANMEYRKEQVNALYKYVADHIDEWNDNGLTVYFDCPVPPCFISPEIFKKLHALGAASVGCIPKAFVMWNLHVTHCYSTIGIGKEHTLSEFDSLQDIKKMSEMLLTTYFHQNEQDCGKCEFSCYPYLCGCPVYSKSGE